MASYRFCRPDDSELLVQAAKRCFYSHNQDSPDFELEDFQKEILDLDLWPSYCMVAMHGGEPVGVLITSKRSDLVLIRKLGVRAEFQRQGHGSHLLSSLLQKMGVLGPRKMGVLIPEDRTDLVGFFESNGFERSEIYADFVLKGIKPVSSSSEMIAPISFEEVEDWEFSVTKHYWERSFKTLRKRRGEIQGLGVISVDGILAFVLYEETEAGTIEILKLGCHPEMDTEVMYRMLLARLYEEKKKKFEIFAVAESEIPFPLLRSLGFKAEQSYLGMEASSKPL